MSDKLVSESTVIQATPEVIFAILADPRQHHRIDGSGSVGQVIQAPARLSAKGDTFSVHMKMFGVPYTITNRVVEFEPDRRLAWRHFGGHRWRYTLEPTGPDSTTVTETFDYTRYDGLRRRFIEVTGFPERNRRGITETLARLGEAAEADSRERGHPGVMEV